MDTLTTLQTLGLELPSPAYILGSILFGLVGLAAFRHGRKSGRRITVGLGTALMLYPYAVSHTGLLYLVGTLLCVGIYLDQR